MHAQVELGETMHWKERWLSFTHIEEPLQLADLVILPQAAFFDTRPDEVSYIQQLQPISADNVNRK